MAGTEQVGVDIDPALLEAATAIYAEAGLTLSDAFRMLLVRTVTDQAMPLDLMTPNDETREAMDAARRGDVTRAGSIDDLFADLNADD